MITRSTEAWLSGGRIRRQRASLSATIRDFGEAVAVPDRSDSHTYNATGPITSELAHNNPTDEGRRGPKSTSTQRCIRSGEPS